MESFVPKELIDSNTRKLQTPEIVFIGADNMGLKTDPQMLLAQVMTQLQEGSTLGVQNGNTLFMLITPPGQEGAGMYQMFNADTMQNLVSNWTQFIALMQKNGYHTLVADIKQGAGGMLAMLRRGFPQVVGQLAPYSKLHLEKSTQGATVATVYTPNSPLAIELEPK